MTREVSVVEAKGHFSDLINRTESKGERFLVRRHGKPVGAIVSAEDLRKLESESPARAPKGALATVGLLADCPEWEDVMDQVLQERATRMDREVDLE
jgi:prevent-host-death family protein